MVWGEEGSGKSDGYGLAKLIKYHPEVLDNLQEILDDMHIVSRSENRVQLESYTHKASVRLTWDNQKKNWLLTAFEKKENNALDNTTDTVKTQSGKRNDTATPQDTAFTGKVSEENNPNQISEQENAKIYTIEPAPYTTKRGKVLDMQLVKFGRELTKEELRSAKTLAKELKGWYDREQGGFMMRSAEDAQQIVDAIMNESGETLADSAPVSLSDVRKVNVDSHMGL